MGPAYILSLLHYYELRWLPCAKTIQRIFELKEEIIMSMQIYLGIIIILLNLPFLAEICEKFSVLNKD